MVRLATILAAAAVLVAGAGGEESRVLWQGPVLAGDALVWAEGAHGTGVLRVWTRRRGARVAYESDALALTRPFAASRTLVAFERTYPGCPPEPGRVCPQVHDALAGPVTGPFRTLTRGQVCSLPALGGGLAVDGGVAAYVELDCARNRLRVLVRDLARGRRPVVLRDAPTSDRCCQEVAIAGRYVAWNGSRSGDVVVYDRVARRSAYHARVGASDLTGFDLQRDGKLAVAYVRGGRTSIAWFSPSAPRPHRLGLRGRDPRVRIAGDRIAFERYLTPTRSALVVAGLGGDTRTIARFAKPTRLRSGFDFDGRRIAWASDRVTATREDCPPPGERRPCFLRETGVTTIWLRAAPAAAPRRVARLPFVDVVARH